MKKLEKAKNKTIKKLLKCIKLIENNKIEEAIDLFVNEYECGFCREYRDLYHDRHDTPWYIQEGCKECPLVSCFIPCFNTKWYHKIIMQLREPRPSTYSLRLGFDKNTIIWQILGIIGEIESLKREK